jgi:hypothetical protein
MAEVEAIETALAKASTEGEIATPLLRRSLISRRVQ